MKQDFPPVKYDVSQEIIEEIRSRYSEFPKDLSVKENYQVVKKGVADCRALRGKIEKRRKELKADALAYGRKVDGAAKKLKEAILEVETPMLEIKRAWDNRKEIERREKERKERERVERISEKIEVWKNVPAAMIGSNSENIHKTLAKFQKIVDDDGYTWAEEFQDKAQEVAELTIEKLHNLYNMTVKQEETAEVEAKLQEVNYENAIKGAAKEISRHCRSLKQARLLVERVANGEIPGLQVTF